MVHLERRYQLPFQETMKISLTRIVTRLSLYHQQTSKKHGMMPMKNEKNDKDVLYNLLTVIGLFFSIAALT